MKLFYIIGIIVVLIVIGVIIINNNQNNNTIPDSTAVVTPTDTSNNNNQINNNNKEAPMNEENNNEITNSTSPQKESNENENTKVSKDIEENNSEEVTQAIFKTNHGNMTLELFTKQMPITTGNFIKLASEGFYDEIKFHRVIKGFMIQAGDPLTKDNSEINRWGSGGPGYLIKDEFVAGLSNVKGTISMANTGTPNSGGSQFFINLNDNTNLDFDKQPLTSKHPVFGKITDGLDILDKIGTVATVSDRPIEPVIIESIELVK